MHFIAISSKRRKLKKIKKRSKKRSSMKKKLSRLLKKKIKGNTKTQGCKMLSKPRPNTVISPLLSDAEKCRVTFSKSELGFWARKPMNTAKQFCAKSTIFHLSNEEFVFYENMFPVIN